jgi:hypothetical protein
MQLGGTAKNRANKLGAVSGSKTPIGRSLQSSRQCNVGEIQVASHRQSPFCAFSSVSSSPIYYLPICR